MKHRAAKTVGLWVRAAALAAATALGVGCVTVGPGPSGGAGCTPGQASPCACVDGRTGAQVCGDDGAYGRCVCAGGPTVMPPPGGDAGARDVSELPDAPPAAGCTVAFDRTGATFSDSCPGTQICRCPEGAECAGTGECIAPLPHGYNIVVVDATVAPTRPNGTPWDGNNSNPDLAVVVRVNGSIVGFSNTEFDTASTTASPFYAVASPLNAGDRVEVIVVEVDGDLGMGQFEVALACSLDPASPDVLRRKLYFCESAGSRVAVLLDAQ